MRLPSESFICLMIAIIAGLLAIGFAAQQILSTQVELNLLNAQNYTPFPSKPKSSGDGVTGKFCGGIAGLACSGGYVCKLDGTYPDAGGKCIRKS